MIPAISKTVDRDNFPPIVAVEDRNTWSQLLGSSDGIKYLTVDLNLFAWF